MISPWLEWLSYSRKLPLCLWSGGVTSVYFSSFSSAHCYLRLFLTTRCNVAVQCRVIALWSFFPLTMLRLRCNRGLFLAARQTKKTAQPWFAVFDCSCRELHSFALIHHSYVAHMLWTVLRCKVQWRALNYEFEFVLWCWRSWPLLWHDTLILATGFTFSAVNWKSGGACFVKTFREHFICTTSH